MKIRFEMQVKDGWKMTADITGKEKDAQTLSAGDVMDVINLEHQLEKLFGLRFHIFAVTEDGEPTLEAR